MMIPQSVGTRTERHHRNNVSHALYQVGVGLARVRLVNHLRQRRFCWRLRQAPASAGKRAVVLIKQLVLTHFPPFFLKSPAPNLTRHPLMTYLDIEHLHRALRLMVHVENGKFVAGRQ